MFLCKVETRPSGVKLQILFAPLGVVLSLMLGRPLGAFLQESGWEYWHSPRQVMARLGLQMVFLSSPFKSLVSVDPAPGESFLL